MKLKKLGVLAFSVGFVSMAHANEVLLTANQPAKIVFRVAHKNQNQQPVFGELQSVDLTKDVTVPVSLDNFDRAGIVIVSMNGHELPPSHGQFDKPEQCSMTTDKTRATGALEFTVSQHSISCHTEGGVFG